jgi:zinc protease
MISWIPLLLGSTLNLAIAEEVVDEEAPSEDAQALELSGPERSEPPAVLAPKALELATPAKTALTDSATAYYVHVPEVRKVTIDVYLHRGTTDFGGPNALTEALGTLQDRASENYDPKALEIATDLHDISIWSQIDLSYTAISLEAPTDELDKGLELLEEILKRPSFPKAEVKRNAIEEHLYLLQEGQNSARALSGSALIYGWYPADNPYGARPDLAGIKKVRTSALLELHEQLLATSPVSVVIVGNVQMADVEERLKSLVSGIGTAGERPAPIPFTPPTGQRVIAIDLPDNPQTRIALRMGAPLYDHADRQAAEVVNYALGGHFLSRLNTNLREEKGLTYGARSSYYSDRQRGTWVIGVDVATENAAAATAEIRHELDRLVESGVTETEIQMARNSSVADWNSTMETAQSAGYTYADWFIEEREVNQLKAELDAMDSITVEQTKTVAATYLSEEVPSLWVFVGDRELLEPQLAAFGEKVEWLDRKDVILGEM